MSGQAEWRGSAWLRERDNLTGATAVSERMAGCMTRTSKRAREADRTQASFWGLAFVCLTGCLLVHCTL